MVMRRTINDPWESAAYQARLRGLYNRMRELTIGKLSKEDRKKFKLPAGEKRFPDRTVRNWNAWLTDRNLDILYDYILEHYQQSAQSAYMVAVASALRYARGPMDAYFRKFNDRGILEARKTKDNQQQSVARKGQLTVEQFHAIREQLLKKYETTKDVTDYFVWLSACLYTLQPPLRNDYGLMGITDDLGLAQNDSRVELKDPAPNRKTKKTNPPTSVQVSNWLVTSTTGPWRIRINRDKISSRSGPATIEVTPELQAVLEQSLAKFPRQWVIPYINNHYAEKVLFWLPFGNEPFGNFLRKYVFKGVESPNNNLRVAWESDLYARGAPAAVLAKTAYSMRHNFDTAARVYRKTTDAQGQAVGGGGGGVELPRQEVRLPAVPTPVVDPPKPPKERFDRSKWRKERYLAHKEEEIAYAARRYSTKSFEVQQKNLLRDLNTGNRKNPSQATLDKFGVRKRKTKDEQGNAIWVARKKRKEN